MRATEALRAAGQSWAKVAVTGREAVITGRAKKDGQGKAALDVVRGVWGIRTVQLKTDLAGAGSAPVAVGPQITPEKAAEAAHRKAEAAAKAKREAEEAAAKTAQAEAEAKVAQERKAREEAEAAARAKQEAEAAAAAEEAKAEAEERAADLAKEQTAAAIKAQQDAEAALKAKEEAEAAAAAKAQDTEAASLKAREEAEALKAKEDAEAAAAQKAKQEADMAAEAKADAEAKAAAEAEAQARKVAEEAQKRKTTAETEACEKRLAEAVQQGMILFKRASADIDSKSSATIGRLSEIIKSCPGARVEVEGHTDAEGTDERNQRLSDRRARAVLNSLVHAGVAADRLTAVGYGASRPVAPNDTKAGMARNRRIEFKVFTD
ncbi:MAG: OmpA family protein [Hyphomicrobium sp.]